MLHEGLLLVLEAGAGLPVAEVAIRYVVSRQSVHSWLRLYEQGGLGALADRFRRPESCPHQLPADVKTAVRAAHRLTQPWLPTTTGKIERFHGSLRRDLLDDAVPFTDLAGAHAITRVALMATNYTIHGGAPPNY